MKEYHEIQTVFQRDPETKFKTLLEGWFSLPEFEYLQNNEWIFTEKVDGMNIRIMFNSELTFRGKTDRTQIPSFLVNRLNDLFLPQKDRFAEMFADGACLYGEGYGAKIQKGGGNYRQDQDFILFDVRIGDWWLQRKNVEDVAGKLGIDIVPIIGRGTLHNMIAMTRDGFDSRWGKFKAEGIVARPSTELKTRSGGRIITKIKNKDFGNEAKNSD